MKTVSVSHMYRQKEWLYKELIENKRSLKDIAAKEGKDPSTIYYYAKKYNLLRSRVKSDRGSEKEEILKKLEAEKLDTALYIMRIGIPKEDPSKIETREKYKAILNKIRDIKEGRQIC